MPDPAILASSLSYRIDDTTLVSGVDFDAKPGELIAVIGPNGAGKSTMLNLFAASLRPSNGQVLLNGVDAAELMGGDLALVRSMLTQQTPLDIPYTTNQVVSMGRFPYRRDPANTSQRDSAAVTAALEHTDTTRFAARSYNTLSAGERTLVSLARVLAQDTPIVLLDEPTTALDVAHQERIMRQAVRLARQQKTVIVVLHDLNAAATHADQIALMHKGAIVARGSARDVLQEQVLTTVYGQPMVVVDHPFRDCPLVLTADAPTTTPDSDG